MKNFKYILLTLFFFIISGCYKKDLEEFKNIKNINFKFEIVIPVFTFNISVKDTISGLEPHKYFNTVNIENINIHIMDSIPPNPVESVELKLIVKNTFPVNGKIQFYFMDNDNKILDSLFNINRNVISSGNYNNNTETTLYVYMNEDKYYNIMYAKKIKIYYELDTYYNTPKVNTYNLNINCGIKIKISKNLHK